MHLNKRDPVETFFPVLETRSDGQSRVDFRFQIAVNRMSHVTYRFASGKLSLHSIIFP
jgi:hypothetical protein